MHISRPSIAGLAGTFARAPTSDVTAAPTSETDKQQSWWKKKVSPWVAMAVIALGATPFVAAIEFSGPKSASTESEKKTSAEFDCIKQIVLPAGFINANAGASGEMAEKSPLLFHEAKTGEGEKELTIVIPGTHGNLATAQLFKAANVTAFSTQVPKSYAIAKQAITHTLDACLSGTGDLDADTACIQKSLKALVTDIHMKDSRLPAKDHSGIRDIKIGYSTNHLKSFEVSGMGGSYTVTYGRQVGIEDNLFITIGMSEVSIRPDGSFNRADEGALLRKLFPKGTLDAMRAFGQCLPNTRNANPVIPLVPPGYQQGGHAAPAARVG